MMKIKILTIFPKMVEEVLNYGIIGQAIKKGLVEIEAVDLRNFTEDKHKTVDNRPFGGGPGMVMMVEPVDRAIASLNKKQRIILLSPQGKTLTQKKAKKLSQLKEIILICGRYEGVDERIREHLIDEEISIGDYVLSGGEIPAMALVDAVARQVPGVLGEEESLKDESFENDSLDHPQYTQPREYKGWGIPEILLSGDHAKIKAWRKQQAIKRTKKQRPDLITRP